MNGARCIDFADHDADRVPCVSLFGLASAGLHLPSLEHSSALPESMWADHHRLPQHGIACSWESFLMEPARAFNQDVPAVNDLIEREGIRLRAYQAEMVEESLKGNIIVVQDTGSGKTHMCVHDPEPIF